jgi:hypothetical protein
MTMKKVYTVTGPHGLLSVCGSVESAVREAFRAEGPFVTAEARRFQLDNPTKAAVIKHIRQRLRAKTGTRYPMVDLFVDPSGEVVVSIETVTLR